MKHDHPAVTSPEQDAEIAARALAENDLGHAAHHIAGALAADPERPAFLALADAWLDAADDPLGLLPLETGVYFGTAALRAYAHARRGELRDAVALLANIVDVRPEVPFFVWGRRWVEHAGAKGLSRDTAEAICKSLLALRASVVDERSPAGAKKNVDEMLRLLATVRELHPKLGVAYYATSKTLRRSARAKEGVAVAEKGLEVDPCYLMGVAVATARREAGDLDGARRANRRLLEFAPDDVAARLDLGDSYLEEGDAREALRWYREALERAPHHAWAEPSLLLAEFGSGRAEARAELLGFAAQHPENLRARALLDRVAPYEVSIPAPTDAIANGLRDLEHRPGFGGGAVDIGLSSVEGPSNRTAYRLMAARRGVEVTLGITFAEIPRPDPRLPRRPSRFTPWIYDGDVPRPALDAPPSAVLEPLAAVAASPYDLERWLAETRAVGREVGAARAAELVAAMLHPPPPPEGADVPQWIARVQLAAACALAGVDEGWDGSVRREALLGVALGPMDWTTTAAIVALGAIARREPAARAEIHDAFGELMKVPRPGGVAYQMALYSVWRALPDIADIAASLDKCIAGLAGFRWEPDAGGDAAPASRPATSAAETKGQIVTNTAQNAWGFAIVGAVIAAVLALMLWGR